MKYYIIAGEASGDLHGSNLIKGLKQADPKAQFRVWGGDLMQEQGAELVKHYKDTAVMGFVEVLYSIRKISSNLIHCKKDILQYNPDIVILIDYPGFNFRIAKFAKKNNLTVFYYISPKVWAWKEGRIKHLREDIDRLFIIFPFEIDYFKKRGINAIYRGNPLIDAVSDNPCHQESIEEFRRRTGIDEKPIIGLLPGSRMMEIKYLLPKMVKLTSFFNEHNFLLAAAPSIADEVYNRYIRGTNIKLLRSQAYSIMKHAEVTVLSSGTASLEAALLDAPQVVCYGANEISYQIAKRLIKVKYASLVNLILNKPVVKELLQHDCTTENITKEVSALLDKTKAAKVRKSYEKVRRILGGEGASIKVASAMIEEYRNISENKRYNLTLKTPIGNLKITSGEDEITAIEFTASENPLENSSEYPPVLAEAKKQINEYFNKERKVFDLPIRPYGTTFQKKVWQKLQEIPYGQVKSYSDIASSIGEKGASRAVGSACKMNPVLIVIPCHRVIGSNSKLTGFNIGIEKKSFLLSHEEAREANDNTLF